MLKYIKMWNKKLKTIRLYNYTISTLKRKLQFEDVCGDIKYNKQQHRRADKSLVILNFTAKKIDR